MGTLPNTLIAGVAKSGTTSLCDDLALHPNVYLYHSKETNYFSFNHHKGEDWFRGLFEPAGEKIILDGSPDYTARARTAEFFDRVQALLPDAQLIFMVRHPIKRLESQYIQELANGRTPLPFDTAIRSWELLIDGSLYHKAQTIITERFAPEQMHTLFLEDYLLDKTGSMQALFKFLQIEDAPACYAPRTASNTRADKIIDPGGIKKLRHLPGYYRLKGLIPQDLKSRIKRMMGKQVEAKIHWTPQAWEAAISRIQPDAETFLAQQGKPADFWDFTPPPGALR